MPVYQDIFASADWYDRTINWSARFDRELPVLTDVFGQPPAGLIDAGCGTGRHTLALARLGYSVVGIDASMEMIDQSSSLCAEVEVECPPRFYTTPYAKILDHVEGNHDGVLCLGNALLAAAGTRNAVKDAVCAFGNCLVPAGRMFLQILNFAKMRHEKPCVRGPRIARLEDQEFVSCRHFHFGIDTADVTNVTMWHDGEWQMHSRNGTLYPIELQELSDLCNAAGLQVDSVWGSYAREPFDVSKSNDLILVATKE